LGVLAGDRRDRVAGAAGGVLADRRRAPARRLLRRVGARTAPAPFAPRLGAARAAQPARRVAARRRRRAAVLAGTGAADDADRPLDPRRARQARARTAAGAAARDPERTQPPARAPRQ